MKVTFNNSIYTTEQDVIISGDRVAFVLSSEQSIDDVFADAKAATDIYIYNDNDELQGVYNGTKFLALSIIMDENSYISVEFANQVICTNRNGQKHQIARPIAIAQPAPQPENSTTTNATPEEKSKAESGKNKVEEQPKKQETVKKEEKKDSQPKKEDKVKTKETPKKETSSKKETAPKKNNTPKKDNSPKKENTPKKDSKPKSTDKASKGKKS